MIALMLLESRLSKPSNGSMKTLITLRKPLLLGFGAAPGGIPFGDRNPMAPPTVAAASSSKTVERQHD